MFFSGVILKRSSHKNMINSGNIKEEINIDAISKDGKKNEKAFGIQDNIIQKNKDFCFWYACFSFGVNFVFLLLLI